ncbi:hypothetical protein ACP70R_024888 [Stipagrostis hirtigluma subsp. patula]
MYSGCGVTSWRSTPLCPALSELRSVPAVRRSRRPRLRLSHHAPISSTSTSASSACAGQ